MRLAIGNNPVASLLDAASEDSEEEALDTSPGAALEVAVKEATTQNERVSIAEESVNS